jgi:DNA-binding NarL/FixJ family response regulator
LSIDEKGRLGKTFCVHSDISHITTTNNRKVSFLGLNGEPSYTNIDVYQDSLDFLEEDKTNLTSRELEILRFLAEGKTASEIGAALFISEGTVRKHRENLLKKTNSKNTAQMISKSIREGII